MEKTFVCTSNRMARAMINRPPYALFQEGWFKINHQPFEVLVPYLFGVGTGGSRKVQRNGGDRRRGRSQLSIKFSERLITTPQKHGRINQ